MKDESDFVLIGLLGRAHGIRGQVSVEPISDIAERFNALEYVLLRRGSEITELGVESVRWKGKSVLLKLEGIDDRTSAERFSRWEVGVRKADVYPVPEDTYYVYDLIGCRVVGGSGREIGVVEDVMKMPANDVFVVRSNDREHLIPVIRSVVKRVDLEEKTILIEEIVGLLD